jgi:hypothetical protein
LGACSWTRRGCASLGSLDDQQRGQITLQQAVMRRLKDKVTTDHVQALSSAVEALDLCNIGFASAAIFAEHHIIEAGTIARGFRRSPAAVMQDMPIAAGQEQDVSRPQSPRRPARRIFQDGRPSDYCMVWHLARQRRSLLDTPRGAVETAQIDPALDRDQVEQAAEPIHRSHR